jgi:tRNA threonylcarbamoyladenosine biosynthesis protein TsaE
LAELPGLPISEIANRKLPISEIANRKSQIANRSMTLTTHTPEQTQALGEALGHRARAGDVFALYGDLGAGKTCLTQGLARGLGVTSDVLSPTFVLVREHVGRLLLWHIDTYRLGSVAEAEDSGLTDYLPGDGVTVVEWAEKIEELLPGERWDICLSFIDEGRRIVIHGPAERIEELRWSDGILRW